MLRYWHHRRLYSDLFDGVRLREGSRAACSIERFQRHTATPYCA